MIRRSIKYAPLLLSIACCAYITFSGRAIIPIPTDPSFHFNLITVNALFGGFLYTNYSLLVGLFDNKIIEKIRNTKIISKRNDHIHCGIINATISVIAGVYLVLFPTPSGPLFTMVNLYIQIVEVVFMGFQILYFLLSLKEMTILISALNRPSDAFTPEDIIILKKTIEEGIKQIDSQ